MLIIMNWIINIAITNPWCLTSIINIPMMIKKRYEITLNKALFVFSYVLLSVLIDIGMIVIRLLISIAFTMYTLYITQIKKILMFAILIINFLLMVNFAIYNFFTIMINDLFMNNILQSLQNKQLDNIESIHDNLSLILNTYNSMHALSQFGIDWYNMTQEQIQYTIEQYEPHIKIIEDTIIIDKENVSFDYIYNNDTFTWGK